MSHRPSVLSLFSGVGGLDLGLEHAGFQIVGSVEIDEIARRSLGANWGDSWNPIAPHDIEVLGQQLQWNQLGVARSQLDVIAGGPPCQPFSKAAQWSSTSRTGLEDDRGILIYDVLDLVARLKPKILLLENVAGFVRGPTSALEVIKKSVGELNDATGLRYALQWKILNANDFGVAQVRKRSVLILSRIGPIEWPMPMPPELRPVSWDAIGDLCDQDSEGLTATGQYSGLLPSIPEGKNYQWHTARGGGLPLFGYRTRYWSFLLKLAKDMPAWTIAAHPGPSTGPFHWDSRPLTVREMLLLQSFPQEWRVEGNRRQQIRQIGNATPPALAEHLGITLMRSLGHTANEPSFGHRRNGPVPPQEPVKPVPKSFLKLKGNHPDHPGAGLGPSPRIN